MKRLGFLLALLVPAAFAAALTPYALECEARTNPLGIDTAQPRLGWKLRAGGSGHRQTAYQIQVSGGAGAWDTGRVESSSSIWIPYAGPALRSHARYTWKVRVWDEAGASSAWSEAAEWTMGVLDPGEWKAVWIAAPGAELRPGPLPVFRKETVIEKPLRRAVVSVSGMGSHELRINGAKAGDHVLAPAWTNFHESAVYETFDVTAQLHAGANVLAALVGNGFYNVLGGRYTKFTGSFGRPRLMAEMFLEFQDGTSRKIGTDSSWRVHDGPIVFSCIYGGEDFDARREPAGWDRPGFDDSSWAAAERVSGPLRRSQSSPPTRVQERFPTVRVTNPRPGIQVYDLGQNFSGWPRITVSGKAGDQVRLTTGELLDRDGLVSQRSSGGPTYFTYWLAGTGRESWAPRFSYTGFRYVQVEGSARIEEMAGEFVHADAPRIGHFACSNDLINRIHKLIEMALRSNLQHVFTDCPHREKLGWQEVAYLMGPSTMYGWDLRTLLPKVIRDTREAQTGEGLVPDVAPQYTVFSDGFLDSPEWGSSAIVLPWLAWEWYGDRRPIEESYNAMRRYADYLERKSEGHLLLYGLGDWYDIGPGGPGPSKLTPRGVTATATYYQDLRILERSARLLGKEDDARAFATRAETVGEAFREAFYKPDKPAFATGSQTALAMPLALGLAPRDARARLLEQLVADVRAHGNHPSAGDIGHRYLLTALSEADRGDVVFDMATRTDPPSYGAQLAAGATSLTEAWDADPNSSQNHSMLGHIEEWFYGGLAGIRPDPEFPGLERIVVHPEPVGDLKWVEATWETFRGRVAVRWRMERGDFTLDLDIPPGMTAKVVLPGAVAAAVSGHSRYVVRNLRKKD